MMYSMEQWLARWPRHEPVTRPVVHTWVDGFDPDNPKHVELIRKATKRWRDPDDDTPTHGARR